jgi:large subunit ribosomal protein L25
VAKLTAEKREGKGKYKAFDLRKAGRIPGVIYGKSLKENINVSVGLKEFALLLKEGERLVDLDMGGAPMRVLLKAVQHGTYEHELLHVDFRAVSDDEVIEVVVDIELSGMEEAPGILEGGMMEQNLHQVSARCLPKNLPEKVVVNVSGLKMGDILYARDLPKLEGVEFVFHGNPAMVSCHHPAGEEAPAEGGEAPSAPEVIGEKEREAKAKE